MIVVMLVWAAIMLDWVFIQHLKPDMPSWSIPGVVYLAVYHGIPTRRVESSSISGEQNGKR